MRAIASIVAAAIVALAIGSSATPVRAQAANTTFVSGFGSDANPCTLAAPCRSFQQAHDLTNPGGTVTMLDPAGYGAVTITKAISIVNDGGGEAGINDPGAGQDAITINAGASDVVTLRGLTLNGVGTGRNGITFLGGAALNLHNCVIRDFTGDGVFGQAVAATNFVISDTVVSHNADGIRIGFTGATTAAITAYFARVAAIGNTLDGIELFAGSSATMRGTIVDSVAIGNGPSAGGVGFFSNPEPGGVVTLINAKAIGNGIGLQVGSTAGTTYVSQTTLSDNLTNGFLVNAGGTLKSFGDNYIIDTNNVGSLTPVAEQ